METLPKLLDFVMGIHKSTRVPHKVPVVKSFVISLVSAWTSFWENSSIVASLRRRDARVTSSPNLNCRFIPQKIPPYIKATSQAAPGRGLAITNAMRLHPLLCIPVHLKLGNGALCSVTILLPIHPTTRFEIQTIHPWHRWAEVAATFGLLHNVFS